MKLSIILLINLLPVLLSCSGQNYNQKATETPNEPPHYLVIGDTVQELGNNIMVVFQGKNNTYWFGSWHDGLYSYDGKTILHFNTKNGFPHNRIEEIKEDKSGNIYFNTSNGIIKFDGQKWTDLSTTISEGLWTLGQDDLWFKDGWDSEFILRYDGKSLYKLKLPTTQIGEDYVSKHPNSPNPYSIYSIYNDSKGNVWFGTATLGAFRFNGHTFEWISEEDVTEIHDGPANGVRSIIEDKDCYFWFNTMHRYKVYNIEDDSKQDIKKQKFYIREKGIGSLDEKIHGDLHEYLSIAKDNHNVLWIATYNSGVWQYDGKKVTHYDVQKGGKTILLFSVYKDNMGTIWLGTQENGVYKFNGTSFERFIP